MSGKTQQDYRERIAEMKAEMERQDEREVKLVAENTLLYNKLIDRGAEVTNLMVEVERLREDMKIIATNPTMTVGELRQRAQNALEAGNE